MKIIGTVLRSSFFIFYFLWALFQSAITWKQGIAQSKFLCSSYSPSCVLWHGVSLNQWPCLGWSRHRLAYSKSNWFDFRIKLKFFSTKLKFCGTKLKFFGTKLNFFGTNLNFFDTELTFFGTNLNYLGTKLKYFGTKLNLFGCTYEPAY